eukprot:6029693-Amphidinium_carterae.1
MHPPPNLGTEDQSDLLSTRRTKLHAHQAGGGSHGANQELCGAGAAQGAFEHVGYTGDSESSATSFCS